MDTFTALADPTRRQILELLARDGPTSVTQIVTHFSLTPPAISQHLKVLREAHLVHVDKRAQQRIYRLNPEAVGELEQWARRIFQLWNQRLDAFERVLEAEKRRLEHSERQARDTDDHHDRSRQEAHGDDPHL